MKYIVFGTRYTTLRHYVEVKIEANDACEVAAKAQDQAYATTLKWANPGSFPSTYRCEIEDWQFDVNDIGDMEEQDAG